MRLLSLRFSLAVLALGVAAAALAGAPASALPTPPSCTVQLDTATQTSHITSTLGEILEFTGAVNVTTGTTSPRTLNIIATVTPSEWGAQVSPTTENISDGETVRFNASVAVPPAALSNTRASLTISANFLAVPGVPGSKIECGDTATISVAQYYRVDIDTTKPRISLNVGPTGVEASVIVHNLGNGRDTFTLSLEDPLYLNDVSLHTNLPRRITLEADAETTMTFAINATGDAKPGTYDVAVVMASDVQPQTATDNLVLSVTVEKTFVDQLVPDFTTSLIGLGVLGALVGVVMLRRRSKRKKAGAEAERLLKQVIRQRREMEAGDGQQPGGDEAVGAEGHGDERDDEPPFKAPPAEPAEARGAAKRVRVKVKAPPGA